MTEHLDNLLWGTAFLAAGSLALLNVDRIVLLDQSSGIRLKAWFENKLGKSPLNRELWPVDRASFSHCGHRSTCHRCDFPPFRGVSSHAIISHLFSLVLQ
jgi:hypothetical protein